MNEILTLDQINEIAERELLQTFEAIQQPRSRYQLEKFVVGEKDTEPAAFQQCMLEMYVKYNSIRRTEIKKRRTIRDIAILELSLASDADLDLEEKRIDLEELNMLNLGALREFTCLYNIFKTKFPRSYSYEELQADQSEYWTRRLNRQTKQELSATGRIGVGNQDALRMIQMNEELMGGALYFASTEPNHGLTER